MRDSHMAFTRTTSMLYSIYPLGSENQSDILATVRVENVGPLASQERTKQGHADCWIAKPLTALSRQKVSVRLAASAHKLLNHIQQTRGSDSSIALALLKLDKMAIKPLVAKMTMINLAVRLPTRWQTTTGARRTMGNEWCKKNSHRSSYR